MVNFPEVNYPEVNFPEVNYQEVNLAAPPSLIWLMTESLRALWQAKSEKLTISADEIKTSVETSLTLLRETKLKNLAEGVGTIIATFF